MENKDILEELNLVEEEKNDISYIYDIEEIETPKKIIKKSTNKKLIKNKKSSKKRNKFFSSIIFLIKYSLTCSIIFLVLMLSTNYQAYFNMIKSNVYKEDMQEQTKSIINSVEAASLKTKITKEIEIKQTEKEDKIEEQNEKGINIKKYKKQLDSKDIKLDIEITPYENRIVIPKIGKNIPLVDIKNMKIDSANELEDIFMDELKNGVIRYPGSAVPGEEGTTFIFGHSSNFPWVKGDYNDVFSTLDNVIYGDEIIVYYGQKKYKYIIREKKVVSPGDISVLKRDNNKNEISLMTCWPVGTTLNRLLVTGELEED